MRTLQTISTRKIYRLNIDYSKSLTELLKEGNYDYQLTGTKTIEGLDMAFPVHKQKKNKRLTVKTKLVYFNGKDIEHKVYCMIKREEPDLDHADIWSMTRQYAHEDKRQAIIAKELRRRKLAFASIHELIWFGHYFPELQKIAPIFVADTIVNSSSFNSEIGSYGSSSNVATLRTIFNEGHIRAFDFTGIDFSQDAYCLAIAT